MAALIAFLLFVSGLWGIPGFVADIASYFYQLGGKTFVRAMALIFSLVLGLVALGPTRAQAWARWASSYWKGQVSDEELKRRCIELSEELYQFAAERERDDNHRRLWNEMIRSETEEEKNRRWDEMTHEMERHSNETAFRYGQRYEGRVISLVHELHRRGWIDSDRPRPSNIYLDIDFVEHAGRSHQWIQDIARQLAIIGHSHKNSDIYKSIHHG